MSLSLVVSISARTAVSGSDSTDASTGERGIRGADPDPAADLYIAITQQSCELPGGGLTGIALTSGPSEHSGVVDDQCVVGTGFDEGDRRPPRRNHELVVVPGTVTEDRAVDAGDPGLDDRVGEPVERRGVERRLAVVRDGEVRRDQQRVAPSDQDEITRRRPRRPVSGQRPWS